jgi:hypothetical protein
MRKGKKKKAPKEKVARVHYEVDRDPGEMPDHATGSSDSDKEENSTDLANIDLTTPLRPEEFPQQQRYASPFENRAMAPPPLSGKNGPVFVPVASPTPLVSTQVVTDVSGSRPAKVGLGHAISIHCLAMFLIPSCRRGKK